MTHEELDQLAVLSEAATRGPWHVRHLNDEMHQCAYAVSTKPDTGAGEDMRSGVWPGDEIVAACLIQSPPYVIPSDDKFQENAQLIAAVRTALPELIRLARRGLQLES